MEDRLGGGRAPDDGAARGDTAARDATRRDDRLVLGALGFILLVTAVWWAVALWPLAGDAPEWLVRTRWACFGAGRDGLPHAGGWLLLIGQPLSMVAFLLVVWPGAVRGAVARAGARPAGRAALGASVGLAALGLAAATLRVNAVAGAPPPEPTTAPSPDYPRLDLEAPPLALLDQHGDTVTLERLRGRTVLITFAFAHCADICPIVVREVLAARDRLTALRPIVLVITLDPWRDTPARLPAMAADWQLGADAHVLSGAVDAVEAALDGWNVPRQRNLDTGDVVHPALVYIVDARGRIAYALSGGGEDAIVELAGRL